MRQPKPSIVYDSIGRLCVQVTQLTLEGGLVRTTLTTRHQDAEPPHAWHEQSVSIIERND